MAFEEYRYDALGRRVLVRERRDCNFLGAGYPIPCDLSKIRRTVWAGDRELWEIQMPGRTQDSASWWENDTLAVAPQPSPQYAPGSPQTYVFFDPHPLWGRVGYVYGGALDQPLSITKIGHTDWAYNTDSVATIAPFTVVPHWNSRGQTDYGLFADGTYRMSQGSPAHWVKTRWRHRAFAIAQDEGALGDAYGQTYAWLGTLTEDKENATRTLYRRNRYVDPLTGQFTQEDPIGLAGGLNLYGFANGDPVTFTDPFGLCPEKEDGIPCTVYISAWGAAHGASLSTLKPSTLRSLQSLARVSDHDIGLNATTNGKHDDPRHNGVSTCCSNRSDAKLSGLAADIGEIDGHVIGTAAASAGYRDVERASLGMSDVKALIDPRGYWLAMSWRGNKNPQNDPASVAHHPTHMHVSFWGNWEMR